jgi:hypothetical protein
MSPKTSPGFAVALSAFIVLSGCGSAEASSPHIRAPKAYFAKDLKSLGNPGVGGIRRNIINPRDLMTIMALYLHSGTAFFQDLGTMSGPSGSVNSGVYTTVSGVKIQLDVFSDVQMKQRYMDDYHTKGWGNFSKAHGGHVFGFGNWLMWTADAQEAKVISVVLGEDEL